MFHKIPIFHENLQICKMKIDFFINVNFSHLFNYVVSVRYLILQEYQRYELF